MHEHSPYDSVAEQQDQLSVSRLYMQLAAARAATIESFLWQTRDAPEPLADTLTLAAAGLAHVSGAPGASIVETARAAAVARRLTAEAHHHDVRARGFRGACAVRAGDGAARSGRADRRDRRVTRLGGRCAPLRGRAARIRRGRQRRPARAGLAVPPRGGRTSAGGRSRLDTRCVAPPAELRGEGGRGGLETVGLQMGGRDGRSPAPGDRQMAPATLAARGREPLGVVRDAGWPAVPGWHGGAVRR